jgi:hypothetical protein
MAGDECILPLRQIPLNNVQIGAANAAGTNAQENLARRQLRLLRIFYLERLFGGSKDRGFQFSCLVRGDGVRICL